MNAHNSESNQKRKRENENRPSPQRKIQRLLDISQPSVSSDQPMKITDVDDDCLVKIFDHLDLHSLFHVAVANEWLRPAAGVVYKRKFGTKEVFIKNNRYSTASSWVQYNFGRQITVIGLKTCLQYLRCLGSSICNVNICYSDWNKKQCQYVHQYTNEYCAECLVNIEFWDKPNRNPIKHFEKPFVNIRTVNVHNSCLGDQFPSFQQWFPNMRSLKLLEVRTLRGIGMSFQHLENLCIDVNTYGELGNTMMKANRLLRWNPQLHSLVIHVNSAQNIGMIVLLDIIKANPEIRNLKMIHNFYWNFTDVNTTNIQRLMREHPSLVELDLISFRISPGDAILLVRQLNSLKQFRFGIADRLEYFRFVHQLDIQWRPSLDDNYGRLYVTLQR